MTEAAPKRRRVHFVSLGCPKNRVDTEVMLGHLLADGYEPAADAEHADVVVVNTCAFIDAAKEESIDAILDAAEVKRDGEQKLVVAGCLSQRYAPELAKEIPEIDHFLGTGNFETIADELQGHRALRILREAPPHPRLQGRNPLRPYRHTPKFGEDGKAFIPDPDFTVTADSPRQNTGTHFAHYLKVSEGCSNACAFCIIPKLRGPQRSRSIDDVSREVEQMIALGVTEFNIIAQDLCAYGKDRSNGDSLAKLLWRLNRIAEGGDRPIWFRCLYAYPRGMTEAVIDAIAGANHVVPYLDMPLQHISDRLLKRMKRGRGAEATRKLMRKLRQRIPNLTLRTTFITGLPGESEDDFSELSEFVEETCFERMGVFAYSPEEDTPAASMRGQVAPEVAEERRDRLMALQKEISRRHQSAMVGRELVVLVEGLAEETELLLQGRHPGQAPEIDGSTFITDGTAAPGDLVRVRVDEAGDYDLAGPMVELLQKH